jgi:hypothetical protein
MQAGVPAGPWLPVQASIVAVPHKHDEMPLAAQFEVRKHVTIASHAC